MQVGLFLFVLWGLFINLVYTFPFVITQNGILLGAQCPSTNVQSFLGIPYAQAPTGNLRFAPPKPYTAGYGFRDATKPPPACIQFNSIIGEPGPQSEDCLFLSIWTPAHAKPFSNLPVKIWTYGGGNEAGSISDPAYDGCTDSESVIQVSINYRLGPLGFTSLQSLNLPGNQGIQDQLLAIHWVKENIRAFGGDPSRMVLFGQSAGSLDAYIISTRPEAPSLFNSVILESGAPTTLQTVAEKDPQSQAFVRGLNCSITNLTCLRNAPISAIKSSYAATLTGSLGFVVDGTIIPQQPLCTGLKVPAIAGTTLNEGTLFALEAFGARSLTLNATDYDQYLTSTFGVLAPQVNQRYPLSNYAGTLQPVFAAISAILTDIGYRCPTRTLLRRAVQNDHQKVWTYLFNDTPSCPWFTYIPSTFLPLLGATHTADIPFVFGGTDDLPRPNGTCDFTTQEKALSVRIRAAWDNMARHASPGSNWPLYNPSTSKGVTMVGGGFVAGTIDYSICDFWDQINVPPSCGGT